MILNFEVLVVHFSKRPFLQFSSIKIEFHGRKISVQESNESRGNSSKKRKSVFTYDLNKYYNSLYLRFEVNDKPGVLSQITQSLAKRNISVERLIQIPDHKNKKASIIIK